MEIEGYKVIHNNKKKGQGGIIIGVRADMKNLMMEIDRRNEEFGSFWVIISNKITKIRAGCIYAPQESRTGKEVFEDMYKHIKEHVQEAKKRDEKVLITGDLNCKIGNVIKGNKEEVTKSGKIFKDMIKNQELTILNSSKKCVGKWTRIEGETKSILDYIIVGENERHPDYYGN